MRSRLILCVVLLLAAAVRHRRPWALRQGSSPESSSGPAVFARHAPCRLIANLRPRRLSGAASRRHMSESSRIDSSVVDVAHSIIRRVTSLRNQPRGLIPSSMGREGEKIACEQRRIRSSSPSCRVWRVAPSGVSVTDCRAGCHSVRSRWPPLPSSGPLGSVESRVPLASADRFVSQRARVSGQPTR